VLRLRMSAAVPLIPLYCFWHPRDIVMCMWFNYLQPDVDFDQLGYLSGAHQHSLSQAENFVCYGHSVDKYLQSTVVILKWMFEKCIVWMATGLTWLRRGSCGCTL
jgi:hypothetical protein